MKLPNRTQVGLALVLAAGVALPARAAAETTKKRSTIALSFRPDQGTDVDIVGVSPRAGRIGTADIKRAEGRTRIKLQIDKSLKHPQSLGSLYTTYVLWAVAPEGRAENLAEVPHSEHFDVEATTSFDTFGLIVTAEPYATVSRPGPSLIAESAPRSDTRARIETGTVEYAPIPERAPAGRADFKTPLLVLGARRAVEAAEGAGAEQHAKRELREAQDRLAALEQLSRGADKLSKDAETTAREVMRLAENARVVSADRRTQAASAAERREAQAAISRAQTDAERAAERAARERESAEKARQDAERAQLEALKARTSLQDAETDAQRARANEQLAQTEAERAKTSEQIAQAEAARARLDAQQAQQDKADAQAQLYQSLSTILETRREARGLIVNLSDVLFDFDRASLKPGAREKLSRLAGILLAYPGSYDIEIEGHTDSVGTHEYNQGLSQDRAQSVSAYLREAGIPSDRIKEVTGFAETRPVASNDDAAGRQMNRRVELVIGDLGS